MCLNPFTNECPTAASLIFYDLLFVYSCIIEQKKTCSEHFVELYEIKIAYYSEIEIFEIIYKIISTPRSVNNNVIISAWNIEV